MKNLQKLVEMDQGNILGLGCSWFKGSNTDLFRLQMKCSPNLDIFFFIRFRLNIKNIGRASAIQVETGMEVQK